MEEGGIVEAGSIYRAALDGSNVEALITAPNPPFFLVLDAARGQIYWIAWTGLDLEGGPEAGSIYRAALDGSNVEALIALEEPAIIVLGP